MVHEGQFTKLIVNVNDTAYMQEVEIKPGWNITHQMANLDGSEDIKAFWYGPGSPILNRGEEMKSKEVGDKFYVVKENSVKDKRIVYIDEEIFKKVKQFVDLFGNDLQFHERRKLGEDYNQFKFRYSLETLKNILGWTRHQPIYDSLVYLLEIDPDATKR